MTPKRHVVPVFVPHLGCPNDCVFCNQRRISGQLEPATPETVAKVIDSIQVKQDAVQKQLAFYGGSFTAIPVAEQDALLEAARPFLDRYDNASLRISTRPDCIDEETLKRLKEHGVNTIELGAQSMCDAVLIASGRGHTAQDTITAARLIKAYGFELILQMMTGLPEDTPDKSMLTAKKLIALSPDGVRIYPTVIIRDTTLHDMWMTGQYREHTVEDAVSLCAALYVLFEKANIPIIRLGLNPTEELTMGDAASNDSAGGAVAGAYHPAFGELVYARVYLNRARALLKASPMLQHKGNVKKVTLGVAPGRISVMTGHKRSNIAALQQEFGIAQITVEAANLENGKQAVVGEIVIICIEKTP